ncbi:alanine--tRNA ligase [Alphaproteobacteria bacterium endosymbiont of Tiliacea citrago]|uniref:alanine--tRNA ligase n=1 Tax=Alphaproteobacteria bacterium endosymbiont of Tiliacea citrago TaxID=3077944 RepID=UPI00313DA8AA
MLKEIKEKFLNFFKQKGHLIIKSASLLPKNDKSILFINSGMAPLKAYFLNEETPPSKRLANSQKCLRVGGKHNDLSEIGYTKRHHTFFEMLGNFSFGDYFKKEAIDYAWEFLTETLKLDKNRLYITIHPDDNEAKNFWLKYVNEEKVTKLTSNIWTMGDIGPWGYCSEIFYDLEEAEGTLEEGDRYLEIWNLVFTQFCNDGKKNFNLDFPCIDTGIGLERITSILEGKTDNYEIAFFKNPIKHLNIEKHTAHSKIFLDHLRSTSNLIMEGIKPGPSQEGYVLRRLIRRMLRSFYTFENIILEEVIKNTYNDWKDLYDFNYEVIFPILEKEKTSFENTINEGMKKFDDMFKKNKELTAANIFTLHDTYGLTVDITYDLLKERKGSGDFQGFETLMEESRKKNEKEILEVNYEETIFVEESETEAELIGIEEKYLIFDKTVLYGEGGGQIGDTGEITGETFKVKIINTKKHNKVYFHEYELLEGEIKLNQKCHQKIDKKRRKKIEAHHSCSHLLQFALEKIYGEGIQQMGSYVSDVKFREDFSFPNKEIDLKKIEDEINTIIEEEKETKIMQMELNEARKIGAKAFFDYEDKVRVVKVGDSLELCGGTHVKNAKDIIKCKILKITTVKAGVKRFEGVAGKAYIEYLEEKDQIFETACNMLNCNKENFINSVKKLTQEKKESKLENKAVIKSLTIGLVSGNEDEKIDDLINKYKLDICCLYIEKNNKCNIKIMSKAKDYSAKDLVNKISSIVEANGGGGNPEFAQTGGKIQKNLDPLFKELINSIA